MKKLAFILSSAILFACGGNETETQTDFSNITFSMDTVVVNPGEEIINLKSKLYFSVMTDDKSKIFLWDNQASTLDIIDLDELELKEKVKFEKEGPNGVGSYVSWMSLSDNEDLVMANFNGIGLFDLEGNKLRTYDLAKTSFEGDDLEEGENFNQKSFITKGGDVVYGLLGGWMKEKESFAKADFKNKSVKNLT